MIANEFIRRAIYGGVFTTQWSYLSSACRDYLSDHAAEYRHLYSAAVQTAASPRASSRQSRQSSARRTSVRALASWARRDACVSGVVAVLLLLLSFLGCYPSVSGDSVQLGSLGLPAAFLLVYFIAVAFVGASQGPAGGLWILVAFGMTVVILSTAAKRR